MAEQRRRDGREGERDPYGGSRGGERRYQYAREEESWPSRERERWSRDEQGRGRERLEQSEDYGHGGPGEGSLGRDWRNDDREPIEHQSKDRSYVGAPWTAEPPPYSAGTNEGRGSGGEAGRYENREPDYRDWDEREARRGGGYGQPGYGGEARGYGRSGEGSSGGSSGGYGRGPGGYGYGRGGSRRSDRERERGRGTDRSMWERTVDEVASWLGDRDAERRRESDQHRGRGPKNYKRSDERIREDVCDRLTDDGVVDASEIEVKVANAEVTLDGHVRSREQRRRAEDCAEVVAGVTHVQNNLRVERETEGSGTAAAGAGGSEAASGSTSTAMGTPAAKPASETPGRSGSRAGGGSGSETGSTRK